MTSRRRSLPQSKPWYAEGLRFTCTGCGDCCKGPESGLVFVNAAEIQALADALELSLDDFGRRYLRQTPEGLSLVEKPVSLDCVFWEDGVGCAVYADRPSQCRSFPFWPEQLESPAAWDAAAAECPGMTRGQRERGAVGKRFSLSEIEAIVAGGETPSGPGNSGAGNSGSGNSGSGNSGPGNSPAKGGSA